MPPPRLRPPPNGPLPGVRLLAWDGALYRIQDAAALDYRTYPSARYRFDAPVGQYPILYTNDSEVGVFAEVYTDRGRRLGSEDADRHLVKLVPTSPLPLVDLLSDGTLKNFELDERVSTDATHGISEKYLEKGRHGDSYLSLTMGKARALARSAC